MIRRAGGYSRIGTSTARGLRRRRLRSGNWRARRQVGWGRGRCGLRGGGVLGCESDGPDSGASCDIEDVVDAAREVLDWGEVETPSRVMGKRWCWRSSLSCSSWRLLA